MSKKPVSDGYLPHDKDREEETPTPVRRLVRATPEELYYKYPCVGSRPHSAPCSLVPWIEKLLRKRQYDKARELLAEHVKGGCFSAEFRSWVAIALLKGVEGIKPQTGRPRMESDNLRDRNIALEAARRIAEGQMRKNVIPDLMAEYGLDFSIIEKILSRQGVYARDIRRSNKAKRKKQE